MVSVVLEFVWCGWFVMVLFDVVVCESGDLCVLEIDLLLLMCMVVLFMCKGVYCSVVVCVFIECVCVYCDWLEW